MKLNTETVQKLRAACEVLPGNLYPGKGGRHPTTAYWLVIAVTDTGAHLIGLNANGEPCSTASYNKSAMRERPLLGRIDLTKLILETSHD